MYREPHRSDVIWVKSADDRIYSDAQEPTGSHGDDAFEGNLYDHVYDRPFDTPDDGRSDYLNPFDSSMYEALRDDECASP